MRPTEIFPNTKLLFVNDGTIVECTAVGKIRGSDKITYTFKYLNSEPKKDITLTMDTEQLRLAFYWGYLVEHRQTATEK